MMALANRAEMHAQIQSALQYISSPSSLPGVVQQAQDALLRWENEIPDAYVVVLTSLVGVTSFDLGEHTTTSAATVRLAAILSLKAAIVRRWKDRGRGSVQQNSLLGEDVKTFLRQSMLNLLISGTVDGKIILVTKNAFNPNEITSKQVELIHDRSLQMNVAALLSKIARMDLPLQFHDLIPTLIDGVRFSRQMATQLQQHLDATQEGTQQHQLYHDQITFFRAIQYNSMNCLENILAELSTQRLLVDKKFRHSIALQYLNSIVESGLIPSIQDLETLFNNKNESSIGMREAVQYATVSSRVVSQMTTNAFLKLSAEQSLLVDQILELIHSFLSRWLSQSSKGVKLQCEHFDELLHVHCDLIVSLQRTHPDEFVRYMTPFLTLFHQSLICSVCNEKGASISLSDPLMIAYLTFMTNVAGATYSELETANKELTYFFTPSLVMPLARTLVELMSIHMYPCEDENNCKIIDRGPQWQDDPEDFYHYEIQRSSDNDVGSASQNVFLTLIESPLSGRYLIPWLMELIANISSQRLAAEIEGGISLGIDPQVIVSALPLGTPSIQCVEDFISPEIYLICQWDAIFTAVGLTGCTLERHGFNFRSWCEESLAPLLQLLVRHSSRQHMYLPILRRRIIWLLSCNAHQVSISSSLFDLLASVLSNAVENDVCVRLTTVQALDALLPQCESDTSVLRSIVEPAATALYQLTNDCNEVVSRTSCLELHSNLITYIGVSGATLSNEILDSIVAPLQSIWENAIGQNLIFRRNIINILSCIASLLSSTQLAVLHPIALRMIDDCIAKEENMFLISGALKCWWLFLRLSPTYSELLARLFFRVEGISKDFDHIMILMRITEHYIILGGGTFLNDHSNTIQQILRNVIGEVRPRGTAYIFLVVEALLRLFPLEGGILLRDCGVLNTVINACALSYFEDDKCEPDRVIVLYLTALSRVFLASPSTLQSLLPTKLPSGAIFGEEEWISLYLLKFQVAGNGAHGLLFQKLWAVLLLSVYPSPFTIKQSNQIFDKLLYVLRNLSPNGSNVLSYEVACDDEEDYDISHTGAEAFERAMQEQRTKDIAITLSLHDALSTKVKKLEKNSFQIVAEETTQQLQKLLLE